MTTYKIELSIDFGEVGYSNSQEPFRVRLESSAVFNLINDAINAHRVYELLIIDRPGDMWDYVSVVIEEAPKDVIERIQRARESSKHNYAKDYPWPETLIPFAVFDKLFRWAGFDTEDSDEAWLMQRGSAAMSGYSKQLLGMVHHAQSRLNQHDDLLQHIVATAKLQNHPFSCLSRADAIASGASEEPNPPQHTNGFYNKLDELLRDPDLVSVAYRASGDYKVLRTLATEQRKRANQKSLPPQQALQISALVNHSTNDDAWDSKIRFQSEGLRPGELRIEGGGLDGMSIKQLIEKKVRGAPERYILSINDEGDIAGFEKEFGDGWFLYRRAKNLIGVVS